MANAWLRPRPGAAPDRQVLLGDRFQVESTIDGHCYGRAEKDGYLGCLPDAALGPVQEASVFVVVRTTWAFAAPDMKSEPLIDLHMTSNLECVGCGHAWHEIRIGDGAAFVPATHCSAIGDFPKDPVAQARLFLGTPYLWAGNTGFGMDCSGLVQAAFRSCGWQCPADSYQQEVMPGERLDDDAELKAGDLIFWRGHVAMVATAHTLIHANAFHMMVVEEPITKAETRIAASETGPVTTRLRPSRRRV